MFKIGAHLSMAKGMEGALNNAKTIGANAIQIFTASPRQWSTNVLSVKNVQKLDNKIKIVSHSGYLNNIASIEEDMLEKTLNSLESECIRCNSVNIKYLVLHGGSSKKEPREKGLQQIVKTLKLLSQRMNGVHPCFIIENSVISKSNSKLATCIDDYKYIFNNLQGVNAGICIDLGHLYVSGVDVTNFEEFNSFFENLAKEVGYEKIMLLHIGDNHGSLGSRKDVHASLHKGNMGIYPIINSFKCNITRDCIRILETPKEELFEQEIEEVRRLSSLFFE